VQQYKELKKTVSMLTGIEKLKKDLLEVYGYSELTLQLEN
jgi:hypothetical protein